MRRPKLELWPRVHPLDIVPLGLVALHATLLLVNRNKLPFSYDTPYHLLIGKMYSDFGRVVLWDYYEYAPVGRPQLYPPLLHVIIWWTHSLTGLDFVSVGRVIALVQYPASLLLSWVAVRKMFGPEVGAVYAGLLSADPRFWTWQLTVAPTAMIMALLMPLIYLFWRKKTVPAVLLMTAFLYSHLGLPYVVLLSLILGGLLSLPLDSGYVREALKVGGVSLLLFTPWALHVLSNSEAIQAGKMSAGGKVPLGFLTVDLFVLFLLPLGIYAAYRAGAGGRILLGVGAAFLAILPTYGMRYFLHSPPVNCAIAAAGFGWLVDMVRRRLDRRALLGVVAAFALMSSAFAPTLAGRRALGPMSGGPTPVVRELTGGMEEVIPPNWRLYSVTNPCVRELARWIEENVPEGEIVHVGIGPLADCITLLSGRLTDGGMYREVRTEEMLRAVAEGRKSGIFVSLRRDLPREARGRDVTVLAEIDPFVVFYAAPPVGAVSLLESLRVGLLVRLRPDSDPADWVSALEAIRPSELSISPALTIGGVHSAEGLAREVSGFAREIEVVLVARDPTVAQLAELVSRALAGVVRAVRISGTVPTLRSIDVESVASEVRSEGAEFGLGLIGRVGPGDLRAALRAADYVVIHVPPTPEVVEPLSLAWEAGGGRIVVQVDLTLAPPDVRSRVLWAFLRELSARMPGCTVLIEVDDPTALKDVGWALVGEPRQPGAPPP
ncbi:MAG: hypothetical protein QI223_06655 [Candidatus Korarchaeota archaeon]|nr:hypothetical protein [Candidatus Korarchaeota archaeon]